MNQLKKVVFNCFAFVLALYVISISLMSVYYGWQDVTRNESFLRYVFVSPFVGFYKATHWPYYVFYKNKYGESNVNEKVKNNVNNFFHGYRYFSDANSLLSNINSKPTDENIDQAVALLKSAKKRLNNCDKNVLNNIYDNWGETVYNSMIPSIEIALSGFQDEIKRKKLIKGNAYIAEFNDWLGSNWDDLLKKLNSKYDFKIKKNS